MSSPISTAAAQKPISQKRLKRQMSLLAGRLPIAWSVSFLFFVVGIFYYSAQFAVWDAPFTLGLSDSDAELLFSYRDIGFALGLVSGLMLLRVFTVRALMLRSAAFFLASTILMPFLDGWFVFLKIFFLTVGFITGVLYLTGYSLLSKRAAKSRDFICAILQIEGFFGLGLGSSFLFFTFFTGATSGDLSWGLGYGLLFPLLLLITILLYFAQIPEKEPPFSIFEVRRLYGKLAFFSFNPLVLISIFCVILLTFIEVHFQNWVDFFSTQLVDAGEWQFHRPLIQVLILVALAVSKFGASILLRKLTPAFYFLLSVVMLGFAVAYAASFLGQTPILAATHLKALSPTFFFIPLMAFLMSPLPILVYVLLAQHTTTEIRLLLVVILTIISRLGWLYLPRLSHFFYKNFIGHVAYYFTLIPLALLFVLFFLNYFDLKNKNTTT